MTKEEVLLAEPCNAWHLARVQDFERAADLASALQVQLVAARFPLSAIVQGAIRQHVFDYADALKGLGLPPERIIVAVKFAANKAGMHTTSRRLMAPPADLDGTDKLLVDMVRWCIERYYGTAASL